MKNPIKNQNSRKPWILAAALASVAALAAGCGKQAYVVTASQAPQQAPGSFSVPPKVDILLVQDDTGSSSPIYANISSQLETFASTLQSQGWDYHFATIPLTSYRAVTQVQASQYDPNWGSQWLAPYPGAQTSFVETVSASAFRTPAEYSDFLGSDVHGAPNASEPAFANLETMLRDGSMVGTGFLRPDAMLAVVLLSTGDDTSNRNFCDGAYASTSLSGAESCDLVQLAVNGTNPSIPCGQPGAVKDPLHCNNYTASLTPYKAFLQNLKGPGNAPQVRFYAIVSTQHQVSGSNCLAGANAFQGDRYHDMASALNGQSYDICTVPIPTALTGIASNLSTIQLNLYTTYLFMAQQPDPSTIAVYRNPGGDASQAVLIPQDNSNGWSFGNDGTNGYVTNVYTTAIGSPSVTPTLNLGSGWAVHLHGSGIIGGSDTATVQFKPAGTQNSAQ